MRNSVRVLILLAFSVAAFAQTPTITTIQNNYARIAEGASNYGIAQGSIFIVKGTNLTDQTEDRLQNTPLQTTLKNVRMRINMGGNTYYAPIYYLLPTQLAGIMPSNVPEGTGTLVVENNGRNSAPAALKVVKSAFGMLAWDFENGTGRAIVVRTTSTGGFGGFAGDSATGTTNALNPNDIVLLYGSGLGPINGNDALDPTPTNMDNIPITINIGGANAEVLYRGRSTFAGLDQINVRIPALAANSYSCNVPMVITTNGVTANATTIPVAATGTTCTNPPTNGGGGGSTGEPTLTQQQITEILNRGSYRFGTLNILRLTAHTNVGGQVSSTRSEESFGNFSSMTGPDLQKYVTGALPPGWAAPAAGVCNVFDGQTAPTGAPNVTVTSLDAGPSISVAYPNGTLVMPKVVESGFINYEATAPSTPAGRYTYSGNGGPQVGPFSVGVDVGPDLVWTNRTNLLEVTRSGGANLTWTGGEPGTLITIFGASANVDINSGMTLGSKGFICFANQSAGQFTVPASILNQLPATAKLDLGLPGVPPVYFGIGILSVTSQGKYNTGTATGVDLIIATSSSTTTQTTIYK